MLTCVQTLAAWGPDKLYHSGEITSNMCSCGEKRTLEHKIFDCKHTEKDRMECDPFIASIPGSLLPPAVRCGIAPVMGTSFDSMFLEGAN